MIRIISTHALALVAAIVAVGCASPSGTSDVAQEEDEVRAAHLVVVDDGEGPKGSSSSSVGSIPAAAAHPTTRLGPSPDPWNGGSDNPGQGPSPDPWTQAGRDPAPAPPPNPGDPSTDKK